MDAAGPEAERAPAGGYGGGPTSTPFGPAPPDELAPRRNLTPLLTVALIAVSLSTVLVLVVLGCKRYIALAKTAEVRQTLAEIAKDAAVAYTPERRVCPSASLPVPDNDALISHGKYQSRRADWLVDEGANAGFACLHFERTTIQHFQYDYVATPTSFTARGRGDLDGDGVFSDFRWTGQVEDGSLVLARSITERQTEE